MRIAVAGSSGLIGSALCGELRGADHEVVRLVRGTPANATELRWDPPAGTVPDLAGTDAVVNLCGAPVAGGRWTNARKQVLLDSRTVTTDVLACAVAEQGIPLLVNGSAVGYYGNAGAAELDESALSGGGFLAGLCRQWEAATTPAKESGARVVRLRTGLVLAKGGGVLGQLRPLFKLGLGARLGNGRQYQPWISITDAVAAIRFAIENEALHGPVNLTGPAPVTNAELTSTLASAVHRPAPWFVPGIALRTVLGELGDEALLYGQRALPAALHEAGFTFAHQTLGSALHGVL